MVEYNWSHSFSMKPAQAEPVNELWIFAGSRSFPLPNNQYLLKNQRGNEIAVEASVMQALSVCDRFKTLDEHVATVVHKLNVGNDASANIRSVLDNLCKGGFLLSSTQALEALGASDAVASETLERVLIRTSNRSKPLARLLESCASNESRFGGRYQYLVFDDSPQQESQVHTRAACDAALVQGLAVTYFGPTQQLAYLKSLCEQLPEEAESIRWLLGEASPGQRYGRGWNFGLLLNAGHRYMMLDDDSVLEPLVPPESSPGVQISDRPQQAYFYDDLADMQKRLRPAGFDPLARHGEMLGQQLCGIQRENSNVDLIRHMEPVQVEQLTGQSRVLMSSNSAAGDPGTGSAHWLFMLDEASTGRLAESEDIYRRNLGQRVLWRGRPEIQISHQRDLMSTTAQGLDNRKLLPPTLPFGRGEDAVFSQITAFAYPQSVSLSFPWALPHLPEPARIWDLSSLDSTIARNPASFLQDLARHHQPRCFAESAESRLETLAALYSDLAAAGVYRFAESIDEHQVYARTSVIRQLQGLLKPDMPQYWQSDLRRVIQAHSRPAPSDCDLELYRDILSRFGQSLRAWPAIWNCAKTLTG